jgi:hypothetical protein
MRIFIVLLVLFLASARGIPQDTTGTVVILSDKIGPTIDLEERNRFRLFQAFQDFESAVLIQRPDSSYCFKITMRRKDDSSIQCYSISRTGKEVDRIRQYIETFERMISEVPKRTIPVPTDSDEDSIGPAPIQRAIPDSVLVAAVSRLQNGERIRIATSDTKMEGIPVRAKIEGRFLYAINDSIFIWDGIANRSFSQAIIDTLWTLRAHAGVGAAWGAACGSIGCGSCLAVLASGFIEHVTDQEIFNAFVRGSIIGIVVGSFPGALVGDIIKGWHQVYPREEKEIAEAEPLHDNKGPVIPAIF